MVADAVTYEPVSTAKSLLTGKKTGNLSISVPLGLRGPVCAR